jgi:hypothetical protein
MSLLWEPPPRFPPAIVPSSMDGCLLQFGITISQVGLYSMSAHVWVCFFVVMPVSAC